MHELVAGMARGSNSGLMRMLVLAVSWMGWGPQLGQLISASCGFSPFRRLDDSFTWQCQVSQVEGAEAASPVEAKTGKSYRVVSAVYYWSK